MKRTKIRCIMVDLFPESMNPNKKNPVVIPRILLLGVLMACSVVTFNSCDKGQESKSSGTSEEQPYLPEDFDRSKIPPPNIDPDEEPPPPPPKDIPPPPPKVIPDRVPPPPPDEELMEDTAIDIIDYDWNALEDSEVIDESSDDDGDPDVHEFVLLEKEPELVDRESTLKTIKYPAIAKEAEISGKVIIRILVDEKGVYKKHVVLRDPHPLLTKSVEKGIHQWKWKPAVQAGKPVAAWVTVPVTFDLDEYKVK